MVGPSGFPVMDEKKKDNDEHAAKCFPKCRLQWLTCEATTFESKRLRRAEVTHASST